MDKSIRQTPPVSGRGIRKVLILLGSLLLMGAALYPSYSSPQPMVPVVVANDLQEKKSSPNAVTAANAFLDSLDSKLREKALYEFGSDKKPNWSNLPVTMVPRNGTKLGELSKEQREKAMGVMAAVLSKEGYQKVIDIMDGDQKLVNNQNQGGGKKGQGGDRGPMFGKDLYYLAIFGTPSETKPWMVQFGGHHLGVNVTVIGKNFILTPTHTGAQPALFKRGNDDVRPLGREIDTAFKLIDSLNEKQRAQAVISQQPQGELLLGPGRDGKKIEPKGIKGSDLTREQQGQLLEVIGTWVNIVESDAATARMEAIKEKLSDTYFAWSGPVEQGKAAYFRVQGPSVVIEYAPQGGTGHIHTVIRNPEDDYGVGLLKR